MKLSRADILNLKPGLVLTVPCETAGELESASQTAYKLKREMKARGEILNVSCSTKEMQVKVCKEISRDA